MKRKTVERKLNCGTMTQAEFHSMIISALRGASRWWKPKQKAIQRARVSKGLYKCEICFTIGPATLPTPPGKKRKIKNIQADHIIPVVGEEGFTTYDNWIKRCFVGEEGFQAICHSCHSKITKQEQKQRRSCGSDKSDNR